MCYMVLQSVGMQRRSHTYSAWILRWHSIKMKTSKQPCSVRSWKRDMLAQTQQNACPLSLDCWHVAQKLSQVSKPSHSSVLS